jgi:hypothetical protein
MQKLLINQLRRKTEGNINKKKITYEINCNLYIFKESKQNLTQLNKAYTTYSTATQIWKSMGRNSPNISQK